MPELTVVTAYYDIPSKYPNETYFSWIELLLRTLNCNVVFFVENEATAKKFKAWCSWKSRVVFRIVKKDDWTMLKKFGIAFWDDQYRMDSQEMILHKSFLLGTVWAEKMHFVRRAIEENPFQSKKFVWCDAGIMRSEEEANLSFLFGCNESVISDTKFHLLAVGPHGEVDTKWWTPKKPTDIRFGGGVFGAADSVWLDMIGKYETILTEMANDGLCVFKDQNVWANIVLQHPQLFDITTSYKNWFHLLHLWSVAPSDTINTYVINLDHRKDRWEETLRVWNLETAKHVFRFPALKHGRYAPWLRHSLIHGCAASHLSLMNANPSKAFLVLEDDADPVKPWTLADLIAQLTTLDARDNWDFVNYGSSTLTGLHQQPFGAIRLYDTEFWQTKISSTTHCMGYSSRMRHAVPKLVDVIRSAMFTGEEIANIDYVLGSGLVKGHEYTQLVSKHGVLSRQRVSQSDLNGAEADYTYMFDIVHAQLIWSTLNSWIPMPLPIVAEMKGGLGNQLFVAAAAMRLSQKSGRPFVLCRKPLLENPHSSQMYMQTIFAKFPQISSIPNHWCYGCDTEQQCMEVKSNTIAPKLTGYFQSSEFVTREFKQLLQLPDPQQAFSSKNVLMHIRGGDYKKHPLHDVDLTKFRKTALSLCDHDTVLVFTNDKEYATEIGTKLGIGKHLEFVETEDEVQVLSEVCNSKLPLICANSSFSWWAAALSKHPRLVFLPKQWYAQQQGHDKEETLFKLEGVYVL